MDATLRLARQHCQQLLEENLALDSNIGVLWGVIGMLQETARLEGRDVGELAFDPAMPAEAITANVRALGQRLQKLRDAQPQPPATNGHDGKRVAVGAGKGNEHAGA